MVSEKKKSKSKKKKNSEDEDDQSYEVEEVVPEKSARKKQSLKRTEPEIVTRNLINL